jgi:hypothetical protein
MRAAWAIFAIALGGCGSAGLAGRPLSGDVGLDDARAFEEFPLFYAGEEVDGLPLVAIVRRIDTANYVSFIYGDCTPLGSDGGCAPPAEIQVWPADARNVGSYDMSLPGTPALEHTTIRGRRAATLGEGTQLEIYAGRSTIVIFAPTRDRALAVAHALRCVRSSAPVPATTPGGMLSC